MNKKIGLVLTMFSFVGCASKFDYYKHEQYGVGKMDNPVYAQHVNECNQLVYKNGVVFEGKTVTDMVEINKLQDEYTDWMIAKVLGKLNDQSGSSAAAGASAAVAVTSGATSSVTTSAPVESKIDSIPEKYEGLDKARYDIRTCIENKGWVK